MSDGGPLDPFDGDSSDDENPGDGDDAQDPFAAMGGLFGIPFLGDLTKILGQQGPDQIWDQARQLARAIATEGKPEANVDPTVRIRYEELARVAELHVQTTTGLGGSSSTVGSVRCVTRTELTSATLDDFRPILDALGSSFGAPAMDDLPADDPFSQMLGPLFQMIAPMTKAMTAGGLIGHLSSTAFGSQELFVPRDRNEVLVVPQAIDDFGREWSLGLDELRLWVMIERLTIDAVLSVPSVKDELTDLLTRHASTFRNDPGALGRQIDDLGPEALSDPSALQSLLGDPRALLGAMRTPEQDEIRDRLAAIVAVVVGYVDVVLDEAGARLIGADYSRLAEALRRRRVEASSADRFVVELLGLDVDRDTVETGRRFVDGVVERSGIEGLARLWGAPGRLPTPNELDAPGLWLARIDLPDL